MSVTDDAKVLVSTDNYEQLLNDVVDDFDYVSDAIFEYHEHKQVQKKVYDFDEN